MSPLLQLGGAAGGSVEPGADDNGQLSNWGPSRLSFLPFIVSSSCSSSWPALQGEHWALYIREGAAFAFHPSFASLAGWQDSSRTSANPCAMPLKKPDPKKEAAKAAPGSEPAFDPKSVKVSEE